MYYYVYVIQSTKNGLRYVGFTSDLKKRFREHNCGITYSTKLYRPWKLIYYEAIPNKTDAINREKYLKTGWGKRFITKILHHYFISLK